MTDPSPAPQAPAVAAAKEAAGSDAIYLSIFLSFYLQAG